MILTAAQAVHVRSVVIAANHLGARFGITFDRVTVTYTPNAQHEVTIVHPFNTEHFHTFTEFCHRYGLEH